MAALSMGAWSQRKPSVACSARVSAKKRASLDENAARSDGVCEVLLGLWVSCQPLSIELVVGQRCEIDQGERVVVRAFFRQVIPDEVAATALDDRRPPRRVVLEGADLTRVKCVLDAAGDHVARRM